MRERESENWGHQKSGDCHQRFLTLSKTYSFLPEFYTTDSCVSLIYKKQSYCCGRLWAQVMSCHFLNKHKIINYLSPD